MRPSLRAVAACALFWIALLSAPAARAEEGAAAAATERWYENLRNGQKTGHSRVVWSPSTWNGRKTLHDTTTFTTRSVRNMMGVKDAFETVVTVDLERDDDGTLWWQRTVVQESGRLTEEEVTWVDDGYEHVAKLDGEELRTKIALKEPTHTDAESVLGPRARAHRLAPGDHVELRLLDVRARAVRSSDLEVLAREEVEAPAGKVPAFKVRERDVASGATTLLWIDDEGVLVRLSSDGGSVSRLVPREQAEEMPIRPAEFRITTPANPPMERVFSADRHYVDLRLQGDPDRAPPEFPTSPWSRTVSREGSDEEGWTYHLELLAYDDPEATTALPAVTEDEQRHLTPEGFEREMEETVLMPWRHERIRKLVAGVVGEEPDARRAAEKLARWVYEKLQKQSPAVAEASALQILEESCGDCSEHALLYVTLCRAAGIPARRCSGYVSVGAQWGAHAWAEIWLGKWVGADPTTGEVGTAARYLFFGYSDDPDSHPGVVSSRAAGRMRFVTTRVVEGEDDYTVSDDPSTWYVHDRKAGRYVHVLAGIEARDVPRDWVVQMTGTDRAYVRAEGLVVEMRVRADQGMRLESFGEADATFAGLPARRISMSSGAVILVHSRRRIVQVQVRAEKLEEHLVALEKVFARTFAP